MKKMTQYCLFCVLLSVSLFAFAKASPDEVRFTNKALPLLQQSGYPWTKPLAQSFIHTVNTECGYRGMEIFTQMLSRTLPQEATQETLSFACPMLAILDLSIANANDPLGLGVNMSLVDPVGSGKISPITKSAAGKILEKALKKAWPYFKRLGGWWSDAAWPAIVSTAKWLANAVGESAAADYIQRKTCEYTGSWC